MQRRQQYLLAGFLVVAVIGLGHGVMMSVVFGPFQTRSENYKRLKTSVSQKNDMTLMLLRDKKSLADWKSKSLPLDEPGKSKQPTALDAGALYQQWLTDLVQLCEFDAPKVSPGGQTPKAGTYISVMVKIDAEARYDQLARFLDLFYRTQLMHRISIMTVSTKVFEGDPILTIHIDAEGLVLLGAPPRRTLFPETKLIADINEDVTTLIVEPMKEFPAKPDFKIRIKNEIVKVTAIDDAKWTVERGMEHTKPTTHSKDTLVELVRLDPKQSDQTKEEFRAMMASNIFVKPPPPLKMKITSPSEKAFTRGRPIEFTITAAGYDSLFGPPEFALAGTPPAGLKLDRTGRLTWRPGSDVEPGKYVVMFEAHHPSADNGRLEETFSIRLRDPNSGPKLTSAKPPKVFLNREWKFRPELAASDANPANFTWKLSDRAPAGVTINSQTGELKWTPGDAVPMGETTIPLVISETDTPGQTTTLSLKVDVQDDAAQFTRLTTFFAIGESKRIYLKNQSTESNTELHEGDAFAISDISGTIKRIDNRYVIVKLGEHDLRWNYGESLREVQAKIKD